jgi:type IV fimbrial biogenesis protein FimT
MHANYTRQYCAGFTLVELVIVMAISAILLSIAIPSMASLFNDNRLSTKTGDLVTAINIARSEATKRGPGARVTVTPNAAGNWAKGWSVFVDTTNNANGGVSPSVTDSNLLAYYESLPSGVTVTYRSPSTLGYISFVASGDALVSEEDLAKPGVAAPGYINFSLEFALNSKTRCVNVLPPGRPEVTANGVCP